MRISAGMPLSSPNASDRGVTRKNPYHQHSPGHKPPVGMNSLYQDIDGVNLNQVSRDHLTIPGFETIPLYNYANCRTKNVIYALICPCEKIYVGQTTQELRKRVQQHLSTITNAESSFSQGKQLSTVAMHFRLFHAGFYKQK